MDLKSKGTKWVGNIYQKLEAICHEVDDLVTQDTVKYAENQVQIVGNGVKRFYSDAMQDLIPSSEVKPGKHEAQAVCPSQDNIVETQVRSMIAFEENPVYTNNNPSSVEEYPVNLLKKAQENFISPPSANLIQLVESDLSLGPKANALKDKKFDIVLEAKDTHELVVKKSNIVIEYTGENMGILSEVPTATLIRSTQKAKLACKSFLDDIEDVSDISSVLTHSEMDSSVVSSVSRIPEVGCISCSSSMSLGTYGLSEFSDGNVIGGISDLSDASSFSQSLPILVCDNKVADMGSALSLHSKDTSTTEDSASLAGSSATMHENCNECAQLEVLMSSLEIGEGNSCRVDITDPSMETIELSEKAELDEGCVVVESKLLYTESCRAQRHRSYKKILQDAFSSKKKRNKEYEQLGILYGDIDIESSQQGPHHLLLPSSSLGLKKSPSQDTWDPEWELL